MVAEPSENGEGLGPQNAGAVYEQPDQDSPEMSLLSGLRWDSATVSYSFPKSASNYLSGKSDYLEALSGFKKFNDVQKSQTKKVMAMYESVSGLILENLADESQGEGDIRIAQSTRPPSAWSYYPGSSTAAGDVWFNHATGYFNNDALGSYAFHALLHEIGHSLGLKHGHQDGPTGPTVSSMDAMEYSVMTYRSYAGAPTTGGFTNEDYGYAQSLMMLDIAAIQSLYGANYDYRSSDTVYSWNPSNGAMTVNGNNKSAPGANRVFQTLWDGGGEDTFDLTAYGSGVDIDLAPGEGSILSQPQLANVASGVKASANVFNAMLYKDDTRSLIENVTAGGGDDKLAGNQVRNKLKGGDGDDRIYGRDGDDNLIGNNGEDELRGGDGEDKIWGGGNADYINGGENADKIYGDMGSDTLIGGPGNDYVRGRNGADKLQGGRGRDTLYGDNGGDTIGGGRGYDILRGGGGNDTLAGGEARDDLWGGGGRDIFVFKHNTGDDRVFDFTKGVDRLDVSAAVDKFNKLTLTDTSSGVLIEFRDASVTLSGVSADDLDARDFIF